MLKITRPISRVTLLKRTNFRFISSQPVHPLPVHADISQTDASSALSQQSVTDLITEASHKIGDLKALGFCNFTPPGLLQQYMEFTHVVLGLPWAASIITTTLMIRSALLPFNIKGQRMIAKNKLAAPIIQDLMAKYQDAKQLGTQQESQQRMTELTSFYKSIKLQPLVPIAVGFLSGPVFLSFFYAIKGLTDFEPALEFLKTGGMLWFSDLTQSDPYYILPIISTGSFLAVMEREFRQNAQMTGQSDQQNMMKMALRIGMIVSFPIIIKFPAGLTLYWATNSIFTLIMTSAFKVQKIQEMLKIPQKVGDIDGLSDFYKKYGIQESAINQPPKKQVNDIGFMEAARGSIEAVKQQEEKKQMKINKQTN